MEKFWPDLDEGSILENLAVINISIATSGNHNGEYLIGYHKPGSFDSEHYYKKTKSEAEFIASRIIQEIFS